MAYSGSLKPLECPDCKGNDIVEDHAQGDMVCRGCGLVVESHIIDERSEWRTFSDKDKESADPNRVGGPVNHLLGDGGMGTTIARMPNDGGLSFQLARTQARTNTRDRPIQEAQRQISDICNRLGLGESNIPSVAADVYHRAVQTELLKGRTVLAICCACIYKACAEQAGFRRTFKEILAVVPGIKTGEVGRCFQIILKHSQTQAQQMGVTTGGTGIMHPADHVRKDASRLAMDNEAILAAIRSAELAQPRGSPKDNPRDHVWEGHMAWQGKAPKSIEAGVLYIIALLWGLKGHKQVPLKEVAAVTGVSDSTIKQVYQQMFPHLRKLVEVKWATDAELAQMPSPTADKKASKAQGSKAAAAAKP